MEPIKLEMTVTVRLSDETEQFIIDALNVIGAKGKEPEMPDFGGKPAAETQQKAPEAKPEPKKEEPKPEPEEKPDEGGENPFGDVPEPKKEESKGPTHEDAVKACEDARKRGIPVKQIRGLMAKYGNAGCVADIKDADMADFIAKLGAMKKEEPHA